MRWRNVSYMEPAGRLTFRIEPMASGGDLVFLPDAGAWLLLAPAWAQRRGSQIVERLQSVHWSRELHWRHGSATTFIEDAEPAPARVESTAQGRALEQRGIYNPESELTHAQSRQLWNSLCSAFASAAEGRMTVAENKVIRHSVFASVELPALRANPRVTLLFV